MDEDRKENIKKMREALEGIDEAKLHRAFAIKSAYDEGDIPLEEAQRRMKAEVGPITPAELAFIEQNLQKEVLDECVRENVDEMLAIYQGLLESPKPELPEGHPIRTYYEENEAMRIVLNAGKKHTEEEFILNPYLEIFDQLTEFRFHASRKQNQLYSLLETKGFDRPTKTMWIFDDKIRDEIKEGKRRLEEGETKDFEAYFLQLREDFLDLMEKEDSILYPASLKMITEEEFREMRRGDEEIGYALIPKPEGFYPAALPASDDLAKDLAKLLGKYGYGSEAKKEEVLHVAEGQLTLEQINLIYKHLPVDLSFVDENELVKFYSDTKHRIFPRSAGVIGRDVKNCHPARSVHIVEEIVEKFRSGEEEEVEFWINKPGLFIYIKYVAVRDEKGRFRGVLEMMQDCTHIRALKDSQTLLSWKNAEDTDAETKETEKIEETEEKVEAGKKDLLPLSKDTKMKELFLAYPGLEDYFISLNPAFQKLHGPMRKLLLLKATIGIAAERSGMELEDLIQKLEEKILK